MAFLFFFSAFVIIVFVIFRLCFIFVADVTSSGSQSLQYLCQCVTFVNWLTPIWRTLKPPPISIPPAPHHTQYWTETEVGKTMTSIVCSTVETVANYSFGGVGDGTPVSSITDLGVILTRQYLVHTRHVATVYLLATKYRCGTGIPVEGHLLKAPLGYSVLNGVPVDINHMPVRHYVVMSPSSTCTCSSTC